MHKHAHQLQIEEQRSSAASRFSSRLPAKKVAQAGLYVWQPSRWHRHGPSTCKCVRRRGVEMNDFAEHVPSPARDSIAYALAGAARSMPVPGFHMTIPITAALIVAGYYWWDRSIRIVVDRPSVQTISSRPVLMPFSTQLPPTTAVKARCSSARWSDF